MTEINPKRIAMLAVGVGIGAVLMLVIVFTMGSLTVSQFVALRRFIVIALNALFLLWAVLYAPLRARGLDKRIKKLESLILPRASRDSGTEPTVPQS